MHKTRFGRPHRGADVLTALCGILLTGSAAGQSSITTTVVVSTERSFVPLQSYGHAETDSSILFFGGLEDMGLHFLGQNAFPVNRFSTDIYLVDKQTGAVSSGSINHLSAAIREALIMTAPSTVQFGLTLYIYGGYGPPVVEPDFTTRGSVTAVDLGAVEAAILASQPIPALAFTVMPSETARVTGAGIVKFSDGDRFALICGADAFGDYGEMGDPEYTNEVYIFDRSVSMTDPIQIFNDGLEFESPLHRRDVNVLPVTLPAQGEGTRDGFVVVCGVFDGGIFPYENPLIWGDGDAEVHEDETVTQHIGAYEGPVASLYSESTVTNHIINCSGLSAYEPDGQGGWNWNLATPWTDGIGHMKVANGAFEDDVLSGTMPWPLTNAHLIVDDSLPRNALGQVLVDQLPRDTDILLGRIHGGIAAESTGNSPPTYASSDVLEVFIRVNTDPGVRANLESYTVERGIVQAGGLPQLMESDDTYLRMRSQIGFTIFEPFLNQCLYEFDTNVLNPATLDIIEEVRATVANGVSKTFIRNVNNGQYVPIGNYAMQQTDSSHRFAGISAANYVEPDGTITVRIKHVVVATFFSFSFNSFIDEIAIEVRE